MQPLPNHKHESFCAAYRVDGNATRAAICAGFSPATAASAGSRLLRNVKVKARLDAWAAEDAASAIVTRDEVMRGLKAEAERTGLLTTHGARVAAWAHLGKFLGLDREPDAPLTSALDLIAQLSLRGAPMPIPGVKHATIADGQED